MVSLWLRPDEASSREFAEIITRLAARYVTQAFAPHVTLLGDIPGDEADVVARAGSLAAGLRTLAAPLVRIGWRDEYFRCLYLEVDSDEVMAARRAAEPVFGCEPSAYMPHLSLVYGELPTDEKARLRAELNPRLPIIVELRALEAWRTRGEVSSWVRLAAFALEPRARAQPPL